MIGRRLALAALAALLSCLALGACGGADSAAGGDAGAVRDVIHRLATTSDPDDCTRLATQAFMEQTTFLQGAAAVRRCRADAAEQAADTIAISHVTVRGASATATTRAHGGHGDLVDQDVTLALRRDGTTWKVDKVADIDLDRPTFERNLRNELSSGLTGTPAGMGDCTVRKLGAVSDAELKRSLIASEPGFLAEPLLICGLSRALRQAGVSAAVSGCTLDRIRRRYTHDALARLFISEDASFNGVLKQELTACVARGDRLSSA